ncbi:hypothetical protein Tco_0994304, partial [Tanacetum coccineum]
IIMTQQQHAADVHQDELCPPNKRYDLMDANKKVDLELVKCPSESKILTNIIKNHPLRFSIAASSSVPWISMTNVMQDIFQMLDNTCHWMGSTAVVDNENDSLHNISRRARDMYHNLQDDDIMKNIFNSRRQKDKVGMQIPDWIINEEMKYTKQYRMYAEVFGLDVPLTQSQLTESTQGMHRTPSVPRSPNPKIDAAESSAPKRSTMICFCLPERRSTRLTPPAPVPTIDKADEMILQDTLQVSLAELKSQEEQEARENVELVNKHLAYEEIEKMMEGSKNVIDDSLPPRNDEPNILGTRLEPRSDKEIPERKEKGKIVEESRSTPFTTPIRSPRIHNDLVSSDTEKLQTGRYTYLFEHLKARFLSRNSFDTLVDHLQEVRVESLPTMVDTYIKEQVKKQVPEQRGNIQAEISSQIQNTIDNHIPSQVDTSIKFKNRQVPQTTCRPSAIRPRDQDDPHDNAHLEGENIAKQQKTSEYEAYVSGESIVWTRQ